MNKNSKYYIALSLIIISIIVGLIIWLTGEEFRVLLVSVFYGIIAAGILIGVWILIEKFAPKIIIKKEKEESDLAFSRERIKKNKKKASAFSIVLSVLLSAIVIAFCVVLFVSHFDWWVYVLFIPVSLFIIFCCIYNIFNGDKK